MLRMKRAKTHLTNKKINIQNLERHVSSWKSEGLSICFTNGCFDLLHVGHITYLNEAAKYADILLVGTFDAALFFPGGRGTWHSVSA